MHERHIVYVDYVSRSYQIEKCRISSSTKSKLIHLGNRRSLQLQKSLPKSHCPESIWRSCPKLIQTTKTPRSSAVPMSQKVLHLPWSSCWWQKWKTQEPRRKKGNNFGNNKNLKNCDTHMVFFCDLSWSCIIFVFSLGLSQVFCWMWQAWWPFRMRNRNRSSGARLPGRQSSMCFSCCTIWSFSVAFLAHLQILGIYVEGTRTCFRVGMKNIFKSFQAVAGLHHIQVKPIECCNPLLHLSQPDTIFTEVNPQRMYICHENIDII